MWSNQSMFELLDTVLGPYTLKEWAIGLIAFGVVLQVVTTLKQKVIADRATSGLTKARCLGCNWRGQVSKYHRTCPKCGSAISRLER